MRLLGSGPVRTRWLSKMVSDTHRDPTDRPHAAVAWLVPCSEVRSAQYRSFYHAIQTLVNNVSHASHGKNPLAIRHVTPCSSSCGSPPTLLHHVEVEPPEHGRRTSVNTREDRDSPVAKQSETSLQCEFEAPPRGGDHELKRLTLLGVFILSPKGLNDELLLTVKIQCVFLKTLIHFLFDWIYLHMYYIFAYYYPEIDHIQLLLLLSL